MATSKTGASAKKSPAKKSTTKKTSSATKVTTVTATATPKKPSVFKKANGEPNYPAIIIAEALGTAILTIVALLTVDGTAPLYVGLTLAILVLGIGAVSGAHVNPAVTFGLWASRKLKSVLLPVYWIAQFVGAALAILLIGLFTGYGYPLSFGHFADFSWNIFAIELIGTAIFLFGLVAVVSNEKLSTQGKAFGIGLSLTIAIVVTAGLFTPLGKAKQLEAQEKNATVTSVADLDLPRELFVTSATLNPAVALAATEKTQTEVLSGNATKDEARYSRLGLEVIFGTLVGAALGGNLFLLVAYVNRRQA